MFIISQFFPKVNHQHKLYAAKLITFLFISKYLFEKVLTEILAIHKPKQ